MKNQYVIGLDYGTDSARAVVVNALNGNEVATSVKYVMTKGAGDARTQPLFFLITTAGTDTHSICFEQHQKALDIIEGT